MNTLVTKRGHCIFRRFFCPCGRISQIFALCIGCTCMVEHYFKFRWFRRSLKMCNMHKIHKNHDQMCKKWWQIFQGSVFAHPVALNIMPRESTLPVILNWGSSRASSTRFMMSRWDFSYSKGMVLSKFMLTKKKTFFEFFSVFLLFFVVSWPKWSLLAGTKTTIHGLDPWWFCGILRVF